MTIHEALVYFDYRQTNIAKALGVSKNSVSKWFKEKEIPFYRQCQLEVVTMGALKADRKKLNNKEN